MLRDNASMLAKVVVALPFVCGVAYVVWKLWDAVPTFATVVVGS